MPPRSGPSGARAVSAQVPICSVGYDTGVGVRLTTDSDAGILMSDTAMAAKISADVNGSACGLVNVESGDLRTGETVAGHFAGTPGDDTL